MIATTGTHLHAWDVEWFHGSQLTHIQLDIELSALIAHDYASREATRLLIFRSAASVPVLQLHLSPTLGWPDLIIWVPNNRPTHVLLSIMLHSAELN